MVNLTVPKGDYGFSIAATITTSAGVAYNLTGYTVKLKVWQEGSPGTLLVNAACSVVVAAEGTVTYAVAQNDFATAGTYLAEFEMTKTSVIESTKRFTITVEESG